MDRAILLGLIVSELVHQQPQIRLRRRGAGLVRVSLERVGEHRVRLTVADNGRGSARARDPRGSACGSSRCSPSSSTPTSLSSGDGVRAELEFQLPPLPQRQAAA